MAWELHTSIFPLISGMFFHDFVLISGVP